MMMTLQGPVLTIPAGSSVVLLPEKEAQQTELVSGITCSGAGNNDTRIYIRSIIPSNPCGSCFQIWPCTAGECGRCKGGKLVSEEEGRESRGWDEGRGGGRGG